MEKTRLEMFDHCINKDAEVETPRSWQPSLQWIIF